MNTVILNICKAVILGVTVGLALAGFSLVAAYLGMMVQG